MELGYFVDPLHHPSSDYTQNIHDDLDQMVVLDKLGYVETWIAEHFTAPWENIPSPELFIAQALGMTKQMKYGTGVTCVPNHNPFHLAHRIAQLDHQAKGRFMWGIGSGSTPLDFTVFGIDPSSDEQRELTRETLEMVLRIWDGLEPGTYGNKFWKFTMPEAMEDLDFSVFMKPYQLPHPPIAAAGLSAKSDTLVMAGERNWMPLSINFVPPRTLKSQWDVYAKAARGAGHTPDRTKWRICRDVFVADTTEEAREIVRTGVMRRDFEDYYRPVMNKFGFLKLMKMDASVDEDDIDIDYMMDNLWIIGSPEEVASKIRALHDDIGGFGVMLAYSHEWEPRDKWLRSMILLAEDVMPRLADLELASA